MRHADDQGELEFPEPRARADDPTTSHAAAAFLTPGRLEGMIVSVMQPGEELTADDICARLPEQYPPSVKTALSRCRDAGAVLRLESERPSARGRPSKLWVLR